MLFKFDHVDAEKIKIDSEIEQDEENFFSEKQEENLKHYDGTKYKIPDFPNVNISYFKFYPVQLKNVSFFYPNFILYS